MIEALINRPATIIRRSASSNIDDYGNEIPTEDFVDTLCEIQQQRRDEPDAQGELSDTYWTAFFLPGTDLHTGDALLVDGLGEFELFGDPWPARNPRTEEQSHLEATLRQSAGAEDVS